MMPPSGPRTVVVHTGGIGDFIMSLPALARLAAEGPVELVGHPERHALAFEAGLTAAAHHLDAVDMASAYGRPSERFRGFFGRFERAVVWLRPTPELRTSLDAAGLREVRIFPGLPNADWDRHASEYYLECLGYPPSPPIALGKGKQEREPGMLVVHPGSGGACKNWPRGHFIEIARRWESRGGRTLWSLGPAEDEFCIPPGASRLPAMSLRELAQRLARAGAFVGNDSGISHLAAACGCPTVAVFGPTDSRVWAPRGPCVRAVQGRPWPGLDEVWHALISCA